MNGVDATSLLVVVAAAVGAMLPAGTVRSLRVPREGRPLAYSPDHAPFTAAVAAVIPENESRKETT
jgi:hypothetical protein